MPTSSPPPPSTPAPPAPPVALRAVPVALTSLAWLSLVGARAFPQIGEALVGLAVATWVPLGLAVIGARDERDRHPPAAIATLARRLVVVASPLGVASFTFPPGRFAAALASAWLVATLAVAAAGLARLARRGPRPIEETAIDVGQLYLPVGAAWLVASRGALEPLGFHEPIVLYTSAHFHFAGFAAPVIAGLLGRDLGVSAAPGAARRRGAGTAVRRAHALATLVVLAGVPLVAAGITLSRRLESPAALLLGAGMLVISALLALAGLRRLLGRAAVPEGALGSLRARLSGALLIVASLSLVGSMNLAVAFALTGSAGRGAGPSRGLISYSAMATYHGVANAIGFAGCALLAYALAAPERHATRGEAGPVE